MSGNLHHDRMVSGLAQYLESEGVRIIGLALQGRNQPREVNGMVPDVEGIDASRNPVYGEAEECDSYANDHTRKQLEAFSRSSNTRVFLAVPSICFATAQDYYRTNLAGRKITVLSYNGQ